MNRISTSHRGLKIACLVFSAAYVLLFLALAYLRLAYPYEVEWMEGAMMDHSARLIEGKAIYTAPSIEFAAWLYPPLFYYVVAGVMKIFGVTWFAGRIVSFLSAIGTGILLSLITKRITANSLLAFVAFGLFIATYHATGYYFDIVRNDAFFTFLLVATASVALILRGAVAPLVTAVMLVLCFLTKQQAIFFLPGFAIWFWLRDRRSALIFAGMSIGIAVVLYIAINAGTNGWFFYYLFKIPGAKRADFSAIRMLNVFSDYAFRSFTICSLAVIAILWVRIKERQMFWKSDTSLLILMTLSALAAGAMSLGNEGGYKNVMLPFAAFVVLLLPIAIAEFQVRWPATENIGYALIVLQFVAFYFNPLSESMLIASAHQAGGARQFLQSLRQIPGEVYIPYHSFITRQAGKPSHAHILATIDVLRVHDTTARRLQADYDSAYATHRFAGVILEESRVLGHDSVSGYTFSRAMVAEPNVNLTRVADEVTRPQFLFIPKLPPNH